VVTVRPCTKPQITATAINPPTIKSTMSTRARLTVGQRLPVCARGGAGVVSVADQGGARSSDHGEADL